jgi:hypothetical protein
MVGADFDPALAALAVGVRAWLYSGILLGDRWTHWSSPSLVVKSLFGHLLAASTDDAETKGDGETRDYISGRTAIPGSETRVFYWLHPSKEVKVIRGVAMAAARRGARDVGIFYMLKFPPLALMVSNLESYEGLPRIDTSIRASDAPAEMRFWKGLIRDADWPERIDEGNFLMGGSSLSDAVTARARAGRQR